MAKLDAKERNALPKNDFGLPAERKYPMEDKNHARNAKTRASEEEHKGVISKSTEEKIDKKADRVLDKGKKKEPMEEFADRRNKEEKAKRR